jgi:hypothetical protein
MAIGTDTSGSILIKSISMQKIAKIPTILLQNDEQQLI